MLQTSAKIACHGKKKQMRKTSKKKKRKYINNMPRKSQKPQFPITAPVYAIPGHHCQLPVTDNIIITSISRGYVVLIRRWWHALITVDLGRAHQCPFHILRSSTEVVREQNRHMAGHASVIHPLSRAAALWQYAMIPIYAGCILVVPYFLHANFYDMAFIFVKLALDLLCLLDVYVTFNTGFLDEHAMKFELGRSKIAKRYLRGLFAVDVASSLPVHFASALLGLPQTCVIGAMVLKLVRVPTLFQNVKQLCDELNTSELVYEVVRFVTIFLILNLWMTFITTGIGVMPERDAIAYEMYIFTKMMVLAGQTSPELKETKTLIANLVVLAGSGVTHVYLLASIMKFFIKYAKQRNQFETLVRQMDEFMRYQGLPVRLRNRAYEYIEFKFKKNIFHEELILSSLSMKLREEIMQCSCQKLIEHVDFFRGLPIDAIYRLTTKMRPIVCMTNDVIVQSGTVGNAMYFLFSGVVAVFTKNGKEVCHLYDGSHFGEISLLLNDVRVASVIAIRNCELYRLNRKDFQEAIEPFPNLLAKIRRIALKRLEKTMEMSDSDVEEDEKKTTEYVSLSSDL